MLAGRCWETNLQYRTLNLEPRTPETRPPRWFEARATGSRAGFSSHCRLGGARACRSFLQAPDFAHVVQQLQLGVGDHSLKLDPPGLRAERFCQLACFALLHMLPSDTKKN